MSDDVQPPGADDPERAEIPALPNQQPETAAAGAPVGDGDLPEWEPLTPELVEDEAIRGDFVLRWAVVGLALLLGVTQIRETPTLVQIRAGQYFAAHGFLPPATDVLSYTATDRPWIHLSWLWDLATAGVYGLAGGVGLSVWQGLLAAAAVILLVHASRPDVRSWWGSICAVLMLLACYDQFTLQPELATLLGTAAVCWWLVRWQERPEDQALWPLVLTLWLWAQFDVRVCLGWGMLLSWGVGLWIARLLQSSTAAEAGLSRYWKAVGLGVVASAVHPQLWRVWLSPWQLYALEYPGWRTVAPARLGPADFWAFPLTNPERWQHLDPSTMSALALAVLTVATLILNRSRLQLSHLTAFLFANGVAIATAHELALASVVNCMICTINAQTWYLARFGQVYSVRAGELLFSRGGRAVTVLTLFCLAWLTISGRIDGPDGKRTGIGFSAELQDLMAGYEAAAASEYDDHPFHTQIRQGDLLIWAGRKSFIDSRVALFNDAADGGLLSLHDRTRRAIRELSNPRAVEAADAVQEVFGRFGITHVMPRLNTGAGVAPDYLSFRDLLSSRMWNISFLGGVTAVFHKSADGPGEYQEFLDEHRFDPVQEAFKSATPLNDMDPRPWPAVPSRYQSLFSLPETRFPEAMQAAAHHLQVASIERISPELKTACLLVAIRRLQAGLHSAPNSGNGYKLLGQAYLMLEQLEQEILTGGNVSQAPNGLRYFQAVGAMNQASLLIPEDVSVHLNLFDLFRRTQRLDLALREIREVQRLSPLPENPAEEDLVRRDRLNDMEAQLTEAVERASGRFEAAGPENQDKLALASSMVDAGLLLEGLKLLEDDPVLRSQNPIATMLFGAWLLESGRPIEAEEIFDTLEQTPGAEQQSDWRLTAAMVALARGDYSRTLRWLQQEQMLGDRVRLEGLISTLPFSLASPVYLGADSFPMLQLGAVSELLQRYVGTSEQNSINAALISLEQGELAIARTSLRSALDRAPMSPARPLLRFYWYLLTDEVLDVEPSKDWIPGGRDVFAPDTETPPAADSGGQK